MSIASVAEDIAREAERRVIARTRAGPAADYVESLEIVIDFLQASLDAARETASED